MSKPTHGYEMMRPSDVHDALWPEVADTLEFSSYAISQFMGVDANATIRAAEADAFDYLIERVCERNPRTPTDAQTIAYDLMREQDAIDAAVEAAAAEAEDYWHRYYGEYDPADEDPANRV